MGRAFWRQPKTASAAGTAHPHGVPARLTNHCIENRGRDLFDKHPVVDKGFPGRIQVARQNPALAQENGVPLHGRALFDVSGV